jgi:alpha-galactosidase
MPDLIRDHHGLHLVITITADRQVLLRHLGSQPMTPRALTADTLQRVVEVQVVGLDQHADHGLGSTNTQTGARLRHHATRDTGDVLEIEQRWQQVAVTTRLRFVPDQPVLQASTTVTCLGPQPIDLDYVSSFCFTGFERGGLTAHAERFALHVPHNTWCGEAQWQAASLPAVGLFEAVSNGLSRYTYGAQGTWSSCGHLPMGALEDRECGTTVAWQIEHHGSWLVEYAYHGQRLGMRLSGPTHNEHHWSKKLAPGASFTGVPVAVTVVEGGLQEALCALTTYRRVLRKKHRDHRELPVIFNDYLNCLSGDPTTAKLLPLIEAAAAAGCEYFTIDRGWYAEGPWWNGVGAWQPAGGRFPGGITEVLSYIKKKGMIPGLWLELEVMGVECPLVEKVPAAWFFHRRGQRVIDQGRYQLDFRHPGVLAHANAVIDRLVVQYGVGYLKMDYNLNAGVGTELDADSAGDGLLQHQRAYLAWLDRVLERHPKLVLENCASGGLRLDYALLARHPLQSFSEQTDYRTNALIAAAAASACTPEQAAIWSYPLREGTRDEVIVNMVNTLLLRVQVSGHLGELTGECRALVHEGIAVYKTIRTSIPQSLPLWPLGLPTLGDTWAAFGLSADDGTTLLAVWRLSDSSPVNELPLPHLAGYALTIERLYPVQAAGEHCWQALAGSLSVRLPENTTARLFRLTPLADDNEENEEEI